MNSRSEEVLLEVPAPHERLYTLTRQAVRKGGHTHRLALAPVDWAERFKDGARHALLAVVAIALVPGVLLYAKLWTNPAAGWVEHELTHVTVAVLVTVGLVVGFPIGLFLRRRPHYFIATFADTLVVNERDLGPLVGIEIDRAASTVILTTERARKLVVLRTAADAATLGESLQKALARET